MPQPPVPPRPVPAIRRAGAAVPMPVRKTGRADVFHQLKGKKARLFNASAAPVGRGIAAGMPALSQSDPVLPLEVRSDARFGPAVAPAAAVALAAVGEGQGADLRLAAIGAAAVGGGLAVLVGRLHGGRTFRWAPAGRRASGSAIGGRVSQLVVTGALTAPGLAKCRQAGMIAAKPTGKDYRK